MQSLNVTQQDFFETIRLANEDRGQEIRGESWIVDIAADAHLVRKTFERCAKPYDQRVLYRADTGYPVIDLNRYPSRYKMYGNDSIDRCNNAARDLPNVKDFFHSEDILDLHSHRVIPFRNWMKLKLVPTFPVKEHQLIHDYVNLHLLRQLPIAQVKDDHWTCIDQLFIDYLNESEFDTPNPDYRVELLSDAHEEFRFCIQRTMDTIISSLAHHSPWLLYRTGGGLGQIVIENLGDYRIFDWKRIHESQRE